MFKSSPKEKKCTDNRILRVSTSKEFPNVFEGLPSLYTFATKKRLTKRLFVGIRCLSLQLHCGDLHMFRLIITIVPTALSHDLCMSRLMITLSRSFMDGLGPEMRDLSKMWGSD
jgi:hypothetical protein